MQMKDPMVGARAGKQGGFNKKHNNKHKSMNETLQGIFQGSRIQRRATWAKTVPKEQRKGGPICEHLVQEWIRCNNMPSRGKASKARGTNT